MAFRFISLAALVATTALAKTDLAGCTYYDDVVTVSGRDDIPPYATRIWYVPDTNEICEFLECGGGRAPPKTNVPGCANYQGTETYSPRFLPSSTTSAAPEETEATDTPEETEATGTPSDSGAQITPAPTESGAAGESSGTEEDGAEETDGADSGAAAMGISVMGGLAVVGAGAWGLF